MHLPGYSLSALALLLAASVSLASSDITPDKGSIVTTPVEGSLFPNWVGRQQLRYFELTDDGLILKTPAISYGNLAITGVLTWERR